MLLLCEAFKSILLLTPIMSSSFFLSFFLGLNSGYVMRQKGKRSRKERESEFNFPTSNPYHHHHIPSSSQQVAANDLASLKEGIEEVERVRLEVAEYFCEDPKAFKLEECFRVMYSFCCR